MADATPSGAAAPPIELILYTRPGCGLCAETHAYLVTLLARRATDGRPTPTLIERDIETDPAWERAYFADIPVVEIGERRLTLATSPSRLERLLIEVLDA